MLQVCELLTFLSGEHDIYKKIQVKIARHITVALKRAAEMIGEVEDSVIKQLSTPKRHASEGAPLIFCHLKNILLYWKQCRMKTRKVNCAAHPNLRVNISLFWLLYLGD
jgi:hypothetical protein